MLAEVVMQQKTIFGIAKSCPFVLCAHTQNFIKKFKPVSEILQIKETGKKGENGKNKNDNY
jgi:hypothetical protein